MTLLLSLQVMGAAALAKVTKVHKCRVNLCHR